MSREPDGECLRCCTPWPQGKRRCPECNWDGIDMSVVPGYDWIPTKRKKAPYIVEYPDTMSGLFQAASDRIKKT